MQDIMTALTGQQALEQLAGLRERLFLEVAPMTQLPEPSQVLDLESRRGSQVRTFKHLHQLCLMHCRHFVATNQIKQLSLIDAYLDLAASRNGLGLYIIARSMFELSAFLHQVRFRLAESTGRAGDDWSQAGQMFFGIVVRARFATSREDYKTLLRDEVGVSPKRLDPFNITHCIRGLTSDPDNTDAGSRYDFLCDFVHHNLASNSTANAGTAIADAAISSSGSILLTSKAGPVTQYEYPLASKFARALDDTCPGFLHDAQSCIRWLNELPAGPYPPELVEKMTSTPLGVGDPRPATGPPRPKGSERNQPCPCGSGIKYKRCCALPGTQPAR